ncbi:MAG: translocation/assembly module TamB domain-containing protein, partial [Bacteroidota bacterium]
NLSIMGEANLNFTMRPAEEMSLTGQYIINDGTYNLTLYDLIKRKFKIQEGSSITWTGDLLEAKTDITAYYRIRTTPEGLIANELSQANEEERRELSQSIPFLVYLNIKGELLNPSTLDFDIETPPGVAIAEVSSKLNQLNQNESEVNKQAIALLTFGNFIQTQMSTTHPVSYEINAAARNSISRILSTQLNKLAEQYIEGVEINVDVSSYADYTGQQTQATTNVALDVQKDFLNERLTVQVGGKANIEGDESQTNNMNRLAGDVRVLYDITPDGRFKFKGFNTTEYENIFEGEITKTGVGIIFNRDIYRLSDLFNRKKKENGNSK